MTIEELNAIYVENCIHDNTHYVMHWREGFQEAHLAGLQAVADALQEKCDEMRDADARDMDRD